MQAQVDSSNFSNENTAVGVGGVKHKRKLLQSATHSRRPYMPAQIPLHPYNEQ
jgi:hypothetical protein